MTITDSTTIELVRSAPANLRDLGGIAIEGGVLREGLAIRTDDLSLVTETDAVALADGGLTTIIDLRSVEEVTITGRGPLGLQHISYHHIPLMGSLDGALDRSPGGTADRALPRFTHESMGRMYLGLVENAAAQIVTALNIIAYAPGATAFHCAAGRDRTGVLAASLLLTLGANDDDIVADYALTGANMHAVGVRTRAVIGPVMRKLGFDLDQMSTVSLLEDGGMEASMELLLGTLRERYGDPLTPLRAAGLSGDTVAQLRRRALGAA